MGQGHDDVDAGLLERMAAEELSCPPPDPVAVHGELRGTPADGDAEPRRCQGPGQVQHRERARMLLRAAQHRSETILAAEAMAPRKAFRPGASRHERRQTATRLRPLARRALITARPLAVFIRARKPWVFL